MSVTANFAATPKCGIAQVTTANANRDGTGTIATIFAAGTSGSRIDQINLKAVGTTTAGMVRLYIHDGSNARLLTEVPVLATAPGANTPAWEAQISSNTFSNVMPIIIPTGYSLRASTEKGETINVFAEGGDF